MRSASALIALLLVLPLQEARAGSFQVSVYADVDTSAQSIPYEELDGLVLAFLNPVNGCSGYTQTQFSNVQQIVSGARQAETDDHPIKVTFAIGGGGNTAVNNLLESIAASATCRQQFAAQVAKILSTNGLDGVDIDWEFPQTASLPNYTLFIQAIRQAIGTKLLSIAIYDDAGKENASAHLTPDVFPYVDYFMVEAYLAPRNAAIDSWISPPWNIPESQLRLGLALFGDPDDDGPSLGYNQLLSSVPPAQAGPCSDHIGIYTINGLRTTGELTRFAITEQLGGITGWELGDDRNDSVSLMLATSDTARMWEDFAQWQQGATYPAGTVVQYQGNLWLIASSASPTPTPDLSNAASRQFETLAQWSSQDYYCGGDEVWFNGAVYRAVQDPPLSVTNLMPTANSSLWTKLYTAALYDATKTYKKGTRVYFSNSVYTAATRTRGQTPSAAPAAWTPVVDTEAFDLDTAYKSGATVRYMGNEYRCTKASQGAYPVVATDSWVPVTK